MKRWPSWCPARGWRRCWKRWKSWPTPRPYAPSGATNLAEAGISRCRHWMKIRVELDAQVAAFVRALAPEPRKRLREGLRGLEHEKGDLKQLEADLAGYARLRVGSYRVV